MFRGTNDLAYGRTTSLSLHRRAKGNLSFIQRLKLEATLSVHNGCVNTMCWNDSGSLILSGSDDQYLKITDPFNRNVVTSVHSGHRANIFSAKFLPNSRDSQIVSCSGDGMIFHTDIERTDATGSHLFNCHFGTTYEVLTMPQDCHSFLSCGEDGTVRWFDLRIKSSCNKDDCKEDVLINCSRAVTSLAINPCTPYELAVGCSDSTIRIFDRRMLGTAATGNFSGRSITGMLSRFSAPPLENRSHRITSLVYSSDGEELLTNYSSEHLYLFNLKMDGRKLKEFTTDAKDSAEGESPNNSAGSLQPPVKRLRLRGDWSDTGPGARPERERADQEDQVAVTIMQRMSDMLSRWLEGASRQSQRPPEHSTDEQAQAAASETNNATLSHQSSSTQSAAATTSSAQTDSQAPSASQDPDSPRDTSERCSNQANETKSGSDIEASTRSLGSQCGSASSRTVVSPSGAGAREMVCRLAKQLTCDLGTAPESGQVRGEGEETARNNSSKVTHGGVEMETATSSAKVVCEDAGDLRECEVEQDAGVPCVAVNNDSVMSASYDIDLDDTACGSKQEVSLPRDTDRHVTDRRTDQPMEAASHESELGYVKGEYLTADSNISDDDLSTHKLPLTPSDVTIEWAGNESKCRDSEILTDNVRSDINLEANNVTEKMTTTSVDVTEDKTACDTKSLSTIDPVDSAKEEQAGGPVVGRSSSGNESSHVPERPQQLPSEVVSVRHMIEPSPSDLQPVISLHYCTEGTSSSTIRIDFEALSESQRLLVEERQHTHAETPGESDTSHATATMKNDQLQDGTTSQSQSTQQAREKVPQDDTTSQSEARDIAVGGEPMSDVNTELNMSTGSAVSSNSDMSVSSRGDNPPQEDETADGKGRGIQEQPHKQLASDSSSSDDREKLVKLCNPRARDPSMSVDLLANVKSKVGLDQTDAATEGTSMQTSSTMESDNPNQGQTSEESYGRRSSLPTTAVLETQRHERPTGHTGPSSGVSRLFSSVDDDDDDDDDVRLMGGTRNTQSRSYMRDDEAERNRAASHLQHLYRQRQAARDMDELEMKKLPQPMVKRVFKGHRNSRTMIKQANFWGDGYVMCGSDCGHIFVWDRTTARLAMLLEADKHVVNCVQPHPYDPILASSGIDYDIKIWSPLSTEACFDEQAAEEIMRRNDVMLEETRDTITVPASFMLRMLASLNHFRGARGNAGETCAQ